MTNQKLLSALRECAEALSAVAVNGYASQERCDPKSTTVSVQDRIAHLLWMSCEGQRLVESSRIEKANRWLGFVQAGIWILLDYSIEQLKDMNKPDELSGESLTVPGERPLTLKIKRLHEDAVLPQYKTDGAAGFDLVAVEDGRQEQCVELAPIGWAFEIPPGYEGQIRLRSSSGLAGFLIPHAPATIDSDYRGPIMIAVRSLDPNRSRPWIKKGDCIAQMVVCPVSRVNIEVSELSETRRQGRGFGGVNVEGLLPSYARELD